MTQQTNPKRRFLHLRSAARAAGRTYDRTVSWPVLEVVMKLNYGFSAARGSSRPDATSHVDVGAKENSSEQRGRKQDIRGIGVMVDIKGLTFTCPFDCYNKRFVAMINFAVTTNNMAVGRCRCAHNQDNLDFTV